MTLSTNHVRLPTNSESSFVCLGSDPYWVVVPGPRRVQGTIDPEDSQRDRAMADREVVSRAPSGNGEVVVYHDTADVVVTPEPVRVSITVGQRETIARSTDDD